jgi:hypothetical protein
MKSLKYCCIECRRWNEAVGGFDYELGRETSYRPAKGEDSRLRQYRCRRCGAEWYELGKLAAVEVKQGILI